MQRLKSVGFDRWGEESRAGYPSVGSMNCFGQPARSPICYPVAFHMAKPTKPVLRAKRPRAEVQEEFSEIRDEVEAAKKIADLKREESARQQDLTTRAAVEGISVEGVVQRMSGLGLEISKALSELSGKLVEEV